MFKYVEFVLTTAGIALLLIYGGFYLITKTGKMIAAYKERNKYKK